MVNKISVIGAGAVGSTLCFHIFRDIRLEELAIVDIAPGLAKGISLDIEDCRVFFNSAARIIGGEDFSLIRNSDIVVVTAGIARKDGMSRFDLLKINAGVAKQVAKSIKEYAPSSIVIVVTNPLDIITYVTLKETGFSRTKVMGMGSSLDSARLLNLLANESKQNVSAIEGFAFGQHNNDMIISARRMRVKSQPLDKFLSNTAIKDICHRASLRGGEIVSLLKNRSASFAPSFSCFRLIKAVVNNGFETIPVSVLLEGEYGLRNVCTGLPCVISKNGIEKIIELELDDEEKKTLLKVNETFSQLKELDYL